MVSLLNKSWTQNFSSLDSRASSHVYIEFSFWKKICKKICFCVFYFSACNWTINWHYSRFQTLDQVGELSMGSKRRKGVYHIPNCQFKGFTLNFVLFNHKNLMPLWVKVVWDNLNLCFHIPHLYLTNYCMLAHMYYPRLLLMFENNPHFRSGYHLTILVGLFCIVFISITILPNKLHTCQNKI